MNSPASCETAGEPKAGRRVTVAEHQAFRESLAPRPANDDDWDEIDEAIASDPILDRLPAYRSGQEKSRLEGILDKLERGDQ